MNRTEQQLMIPGTEEIHETGDQEQYEQFVEKFKAKKTTDDCYTPPEIYEGISDWVAAEYGLDKRNFVRPFWPGGDYRKGEYPAGCVVVDNPPFSILMQIIDYYLEKGVGFFLFAPTLTLFQCLQTQRRK